MRGRVGLAALAGALAGGLSGMPLAPFLEPALKSGLPIGYGEIGGTVWSGWVDDVEAGPDRLGLATVGFAPGALLSGQVGFDVRVSGGVGIGQGQIRTGLGQRLGLRNLNLKLDGGLLARVQPAFAATNGHVLLAVERLDLLPAGCVAASGSLSTDLLVGAFAPWQGPVLSGPISCREGKLMAVLQGRAPNEDFVNVEITLDAHIAVLSASMVTRDATLQHALETLGFQRQGEAYVYRWSGPLAPG